MQPKKIAYLPLIQGIYFFITLAWPVLDMENFMRVTGPKTDIWLVKSVSVLLFPYSVVCFWAAFNFQKITKIIILLIVLACLGLAFVEFYYYFNGTIKWVYGADAILQILFSIWWILRPEKSNNMISMGTAFHTMGK